MASLHEKKHQEKNPVAVPASQDVLNEFVYRVSHDLGAPLRGVVNFSKLLEKDYAEKLDGKGLKYLSFILDGGEKAQAMLQGLVQYSRLNTTATPMVVMDMSQILRSCQLALQQKITDTHAVIHADTLSEVYGDTVQIVLLLKLLLDNALTYHAPDTPPEVKCYMERNGDEGIFYIEDNGIGILPKDAERVFGLFTRLHADSEYPGIGIGLTLARGIVTRHHGNISLIPNANKSGLTVRFTLPLSEKHFTH